MNRASSSKLLLAAGLAAFAAAACQSVATAQAPTAPPPAAQPASAWSAKNLKVLPADIPRPALINIMKSFTRSLGVECSFCHANGPDGKMDPSLDTNEHKASARWMMKMAEELNAKFDAKPGEPPKVTCYTCHRGYPHPLIAPPPEASPGPAKSQS
nr:c-type cytochrome [uncultured Sphingomonas sp.]